MKPILLFLSLVFLGLAFLMSFSGPVSDENTNPFLWEYSDFIVPMFCFAISRVCEYFALEDRTRSRQVFLLLQCLIFGIFIWVLNATMEINFITSCTKFSCPL